MNKMYIVKYDTGHYSDANITTVFVTSNKIKATNYVTKFNALLKKWEKYYQKYEAIGGLHWIKDEYEKKYFRRWNCLKETNYAFWEKVEIR